MASGEAPLSRVMDGDAIRPVPLIGGSIAVINETSQQVVETIGLGDEGIKREQVFVAGECQDVHVYGL